jgi:antirestriction protein ArdC
MAWKSSKTEGFRDVAQELTDRIITMIENGGKIPWKREWDSSKCAGPQAPVNAFTGELYHGMNSLSFGLDPRAIVTADPRWATFKHAADEHCHVKKGAKSVLGIYYKPLEIEDDKADDGKRLVPLLKTFHVFHASEIEGLPACKAPSMESPRGRARMPLAPFSPPAASKSSPAATGRFIRPYTTSSNSRRMWPSRAPNTGAPLRFTNSTMPPATPDG